MEVNWHSMGASDDSCWSTMDTLIIKKRRTHERVIKEIKSAEFGDELAIRRRER